MNSTNEFSLRAILLAIAITLLFTSANVYLGLKVGMTFSTALPSAVISMAFLRILKNSNALENVTVQTITSAAGTLSSVVFVIPGLIMLAVWKDFPFWQTFFISALGGIFGVMLSIPLRRALVVNSKLPYPEGCAAAEVIRVGCDTGASNNSKIAGIKQLTIGGLIGFFYQLFSNGFNVVGNDPAYFVSIKKAVFGLSGQLSFALLGIGYIIGFETGLALLLGVILAWFIFLPYFSLQHVISGDLTNFAITTWSQNIRPIGVGCIAMASTAAIIQLIKPVIGGIKDAFAHSKRVQQGELIASTERDMPVQTIFIVTGLLIFPMIALFWYFMNSLGGLSFGVLFPLTILAVFATLLIGSLTAAASGYMAGIIGSSNSPISGIAILTAIIIAFFLLFLNKNGFFGQIQAGMDLTHILIAIALFISCMVISIAAISNDNLQDLKTAHLLGATPWKQQTALVIGVLAGSIVIPFTLNMLANSYGFVGQPGANPLTALQAPQASAIYAVTAGILGQNMHWGKIFFGIMISLIILTVNSFYLKKKGYSINIFAVGIGIYLPMDMVTMIIIGSFLSFFVRRYIKVNQLTPERKELIERRALLVASGMIVGDAVMGVILAFLIGLTKDFTVISLVGAHFQNTANILGIVVCLGIIYWFYKYAINARGRN